MDKNIGSILKEKRMESGLSVKEISSLLTSKGYKASEKTIYSWESGNSQPTPDALLEMCDAYGIKDILPTFGYNGYKEDGSLKLNIKEQDLIEKYRALDPYGQEAVSYVLGRESARMAALLEKDNRIAELEAALHKPSVPLRIYTYMHKIAAAGTGFYFEDIPTDTIEAPYLENADFIIGVSGDSMEPTYSDGDLVYVEKCQTVETGSIGIFILNKECLIKEAGEHGLLSHNHKYDMIPGSSDIICVGKVLGKVELE